MRRRMAGVGVVALLAGCGSEADGEFRVPSESMSPTYNLNDVVEVDKDPDSVGVGDVVIFHPPKGAELNQCNVRKPDNQACPEPTANESDVLFIKRIVAKPGDRLSVRGGRVYIDGAPADEDYARLSETCATCNLERPITVPPDHLFVLGDNRGQSADSREWGPIRSDWITAKVVRVKERADEGDDGGPEIE